MCRQQLVRLAERRRAGGGEPGEGENKSLVRSGRLAFPERQGPGNRELAASTVPLLPSPTPWPRFPVATSPGTHTRSPRPARILPPPRRPDSPTFPFASFIMQVPSTRKSQQMGEGIWGLMELFAFCLFYKCLN